MSEVQNILVITDRADAGWTRAARQEIGVKCWHVLTLGNSADVYVRRNNVALERLRWETVRAERYAGPAQDALQAFYPSFAYHFPRHVRLNGKTFLDLLRQPGGTNLWWYGETCEKAPLRGPLLHQLYRLAILRRVLDDRRYDAVWLWVQDPHLRGCVAQSLSANAVRVRIFTPRVKWRWKDIFKNSRGLGALARMLAVRMAITVNLLVTRWVLARARVRRFVQSDEGRPVVAFYSRYPILWQYPYTVDHRERYFHYPATKLQERAKTVYAVWLSDWSWQLWRRRREIADLFKKDSIIPLELELPVRHLLAALVGLWLPLRYMRYHLWMAPWLAVEFEGWDISRLWDAELRRMLTGVEIQRNPLLEDAVRRLTSRLAVRVILNPLEFQPMERALWAGAEGRAARLAVQHSTFCRNHLLYFFRHGELREYVEGDVPDPSPVPDYYAATGTWARRVLIENGAAPERIALCGAVRYNTLRLEERDSNEALAMRQRLGISSRDPVILVLTPISHAESQELVETLAHAVRLLHKPLFFLFKSHYHCRMEAEVYRLFSGLLPPGRWENLHVDVPIYDYIRAADVVVAGGSTVAVEAYMLGHKPIVYQCPTLLNLNALMDSPGAAEFVFTPADLAEALMRLAANSLHRQTFAAVRDATMERLFYRLDQRADERLMTYIEELGLLCVAGATFLESCATPSGPTTSTTAGAATS